MLIFLVVDIAFSTHKTRYASTGQALEDVLVHTKPAGSVQYECEGQILWIQSVWSLSCRGCPLLMLRGSYVFGFFDSSCP